MAHAAAGASASEELDSTTLDGRTVLNHEIRRLGEKIDNMSVSASRDHDRMAVRRNLEARRLQAEYLAQKVEQYRVGEGDYVSRPVVPNRSPLRSPGGTLVSPVEPRMRGVEGRGGDEHGYPVSPQDFPVRSSSMAQEGRYQYEEERRQGWR